MTAPGWITEEIQAAAAEIADAIDGAGAPVTIRKPNQADVTVTAVVYQDNSRPHTAVADPSVEVSGWIGLFKPDAPLVMPFTVVMAGGEHLMPDVPPQDVAGQGVLLMAHLVPLPDRTRVSTLTFTTPGPLVRDPKTGNMQPSQGPPIVVQARLAASSDPRIRDMAGADAAEVVLIGRWGTFEKPQARPAGVRWGSTCPLVVDGQNGLLTVKIAYPDPDELQEAQLGARFVATWKSTP